VAVPVELLLGSVGVLEFVEVLLLDATVVGVPIDVTVVELDVGAVLDTGIALCVVLAATFVSAVSVTLGTSASDPRSIMPTFGATRLGIESDTVDAVPELDPSPAPQAARPNVRRLHNTMLRMCERAAKAEFFMITTPVGR